MGFRSTFTTEDVPIKWPEWFVNKYVDWVHFDPKHTGTISSKAEMKTYVSLVEDIDKVIQEWDFGSEFSLVFLHECGGVTRCSFRRGRSVIFSEPIDWHHDCGWVRHSYCYGCSSPDGRQ